VNLSSLPKETDTPPQTTTSHTKKTLFPETSESEGEVLHKNVASLFGNLIFHKKKSNYSVTNHTHDIFYHRDLKARNLKTLNLMLKTKQFL